METTRSYGRILQRLRAKENEIEKVKLDWLQKI